MIKRLLTAVSLAGAVLWTALAADPAYAERRVALVIGNSNYGNPTLNLVNPKNDAEDIATALRALDFEVIQVVNARKPDVQSALQKFARAAINADSALFFYAGHAMQFEGRNYLMPVDAELQDVISLHYEMVGIDEIRASLGTATGVKIMILDACRNNPLADKLLKSVNGGASRSVNSTRGLARIDKTQGMVVAYATAADDVALDGNGRNSPFTTALLKRMRQPGLEIVRMFQTVAEDVYTSTNGRQRPELSIDFFGDYFLNNKDRLAWDQIRDSISAEDFRQFIQRFPASPRALDAKYRLDLLERMARERELERQKMEAEAQARREAEARVYADAERLRREQTANEQRVAEERARLDSDRRRREAEAEQARVAAERQAAEQARVADQRRQAEEQARVVEEKRQSEQQQAQLSEQQRRAEEEAQAKVTELKQQAEQQSKAAAMKRLAELQAKIAEQRRVAEEAKLTEQKQQADQQAALADQKRQAEQQAALAEQKQQADQQAALAEQKRQAVQQAKLAAQKRQAEQQAALAEQKRQAEQQAALAEQKRQAEQQAKLAEQKRQAEQQAKLAEQKRQAEQQAQLAEQKRQAEQQVALAEQKRLTEQRTKAAGAEATRVNAEVVCQQEDERLALLQAAGPGAHDDLVQFQQAMHCDRLRPMVMAALGDELPKPDAKAPVTELPATQEKPSQEEPSNTKELIASAQAELHRLGCFSGREDGHLTSATKSAIGRYLGERAKQGVTDKVTESFIAELKDTADRVCPLECGAGKVEEGGRCIASRPEHERVKRVVTRPEREQREQREPPRQQRQPVQQVARPRPQPTARASASAGGGGGGGASHSPSLMGVGF